MYVHEHMPAYTITDAYDTVQDSLKTGDVVLFIRQPEIKSGL